MGTDISSKLLYGMNYNDLVKNLTEDQVELLDEDLEYGDIEYASPYYDSSREQWFVGVEIEDGVSYENLDKLVDDVNGAEGYFLERFGVIGKLKSCKHVY